MHEGQNANSSNVKIRYESKRKFPEVRHSVSLRSRGQSHSAPDPPVASIALSSSPVSPKLSLAIHSSWAVFPVTPATLTTSPFCSLCSSFIVMGGVGHNIKEQEKTQQVFQVTKAIPHPDYNPRNFPNDITLLQVRKPPAALALLGPDGFSSLGPLPSFFPTLDT